MKLRRSDLPLVALTALLLGAVRILLVVLPFAQVQSLLNRLLTRSRAQVPAARVAWAVQALSRRAPGPTTCLAQALVAHALLRRFGHPSVLRIGVRDPRLSRQLSAHAWVECDGRVVIGALPDLGDYAALKPAERA